MASSAGEVMDNKTSEELAQVLAMMKKFEDDYLREKDVNADKDRLVVDCLKLRSQDSVPPIDFKFIERITHFWIDDNLEYNASKSLPKLNFPDDCEDIDLNLFDGFDMKTLIEDYDMYKDLKWSYLLRTISDNDLIRQYEPQFVSFGGVIGEILATIYDTGIHWMIWAQRVNGVIFIRKIKTEKTKVGYQLQEFQKNSFAILKFIHFITDGKYNDMSEAVKCFAINNLELADNRILTLSEVNAVDENERSIDAKLMERSLNYDYYLKKKLLRLWSKGLVQGVQRLIVGTKISDCVATIEAITLDEITDKCSNKWSPHRCILFLNRFLNFMKNVIKDDNVYEFVYHRGEDLIECARIHKKVTESIVNQVIF